MRVVLIEPQIPPNTGNVARLCAATGLPLHLVEPLGFQISDRHLRRAGLDYWEFLDLHLHASLEELLEEIPSAGLRFFSKKAERPFVECCFGADDTLVFGSETKGLPDRLWNRYPESFWRIPIFHPGVRSLNLSSAVSIVTYEALRQQGRLGSGRP